MLSNKTFSKMTPEQRKWLSQQGNRAREPPSYLPIPKAFQRFAILGSLEFDKPIVRTALFFGCGHTGRYDVLVGSNEKVVPAGWYNGVHGIAAMIPPSRVIY